MSRWIGEMASSVPPAARGGGVVKLVCEPEEAGPQLHPALEPAVSPGGP